MADMIPAAFPMTGFMKRILHLQSRRENRRAAGRRAGCTVYIHVPVMRSAGQTITKDDLRTRVAIGEEAGADYYISIHTNASEYGDGASGFEAYIDYENDTITAMAQSIEQKLMQLGYTQNRGLKSTQESSLYVIDSNPVPAMLLELGFITDSADAAICAARRDRLPRTRHCTGNPGTALAFTPFLGYN